jgi:hypothetical protein
MMNFMFSVLNDDDLNSSGGGGGNNSSSNKLGLHIKSEQDPMSDPLAGVDSSFGQMPGSNRPMMSQTSPERIQPLPSNIVNKSNSMDVSCDDHILRESSNK